MTRLGYQIVGAWFLYSELKKDSHLGPNANLLWFVFFFSFVSFDMLKDYNKTVPITCLILKQSLVR